MGQILFDKQDYQEQCVANIVEVLAGTDGFKDTAALIANLENLQKKQRIMEVKNHRAPKLDVIMETGTGKTFTYIQTMYELNKQYSINKFIIFVPRRAIREGVVQNLNLTENYFAALYKSPPSVHSYSGDGDDSGVRSFLEDDEFSVLIITSQSIAVENKNSRVLTKPREYLDGGKTILEMLKDLQPVVIIDEPHLLKGEKFIQAYAAHFSGCLCLRFGATFPDKSSARKNNTPAAPQLEDSLALSNVVYSMDSLSAFRNYLVKQIQVNDASGKDNNINFLSHLKGVIKISYSENNIVKHKEVKLKDDLGIATGIPDYNQVYINKVSAGVVYLNNRQRHKLMDKADLNLSDEVIRTMLAKTIEAHFAKERKLFAKNIKTLSLFFIPRINDFDGPNPRIKKIFDEEYLKQRAKVIKQAKGKYRAYLEKDFDEDAGLNPIRKGYFSGDGKSEDAPEVAEKVQLILKDKLRLISTAEPLRFIFSVWALQEGWDNPNIFNICKLAPSRQNISRRQQVGRGLRLAVNDSGLRQTIERCRGEGDFYDINRLDVIVSALEGDYIEGLQNEINDNSYIFAGNTLSIERLQKIGLKDAEILELLHNFIANSIIERQEDSYLVVASIYEHLTVSKEEILKLVNQQTYETLLTYFDDSGSNSAYVSRAGRAKIKIRQNKLKEFDELWRAINRKAKIIYRNINEEELVDAVAKRFNNESISPVKVVVRAKRYDHNKNIIENISEQTYSEVNFFQHKNSYNKFITDFAKNENLPMNFVMKCFSKIKPQLVANNPKEAYRILIDATKETIHQKIVQSVGYDFNSNISISGEKEGEVFYDDKGKFVKEIDAHLLGSRSSDATPSKNYLYHKIMFDSNIERDASLPAGDPGEINDMKIRVFAKLPPISIPTPFKVYNPDFAYLMESKNNKKIYFVVETKGYGSAEDIPDSEKSKISYARKFFEALGNSEDIKRQGIQVVFKQRINRKEMRELLEEIREEP